MKTLLTLIAACSLTSCTLTFNPDGSKSATIDAPTAIKLAEIYATK